MKKEKKNSFLYKVFIIIVLIIIALIFYSRYIGTKGLIVKETRIISKDLPSCFSGLKIIHFSDVYYLNTTEKSDLDKISEKINELKPDIIIFSGNIFTKNKKMNKSEKEELVTFLYSLESSLGKYAVKGESDYNIDYEEILNNANFILLNNSYDLIYSGGLTPIFIAGLPAMNKEVANYDKIFEYYQSEKELINKANYKIIVSSDGNIIDKVKSIDPIVNLYLASASLNGSVKVPFYGPLYIPKNSSKYYAPHYNLENGEAFISSGIGTDKIKFRFNNKPSINLYRLKSI